MQARIDALLVKARLPSGTGAELRTIAAALSRQCLQPGERLQVAQALEQDLVYLYLHSATGVAMQNARRAALEEALARLAPTLTQATTLRLERVFDVRGASSGATPLYHYAVEMDPEAGWLPAISDWYDEEHMPGLASVPGCIHASRYLNHDGGPLSLACYDLITPQTKGSPPWMVWTNTEWSSRMRPKFTNTLRTMFEVFHDHGQALPPQ